MSEASAPAAIVVGLGAFGAEVAREIADDEVLGSGQRLVATLAWSTPPDAGVVAQAVVQRAREALAHERVARERDASGAGGQAWLVVLVLAHLGDDAARAAVGPVLFAVQERLLRELGPIFEAFRSGERRNLSVIPVLAMPHPAAHERGDDVARTVRELAAAVAALAPSARAIPHVELIEDVAEFSVMSESEMSDAVRNFAVFLLCAAPGLERARALFEPSDVADPLATFACATAELPRARLRAYGNARVALEVVESILDAPAAEATLTETDVLEGVDLAPLEPNDASGRDVLDVLERYAPPAVRDTAPRWWERSETLRERYGADPGDPAHDAPAPPADPPVGFARDRMTALEAGWRILQRSRFDDVVAADRARIELARDTVRERIASRLDRQLFADSSPTAFARTSSVADKLRRALDERLSTAIRLRDDAVPAPAPSFEAFRTAHASLLDAARRKPDLGAMALFAVLGTLAILFFAPPALAMLGDAIGASPGDWYEPLLRGQSWVTALVLALALVVGPLALRYWRAVRAVADAHDAMWRALEDTRTGQRESLLDYFATRLTLSRRVARVEALLAIVAGLDRDRERLALVQRAVRRARGALLEELTELGAVRDEAGRFGLQGLFGTDRGSLRGSLVGPAALDALETTLAVESRDARVRDVLSTLAREGGWSARWREALPFASMDALKAAAAPHAAAVAQWDPFADHVAAKDTVRHLARFVRRQARSLELALNFSGHEHDDATGIAMVLAGVAVLPPAAVAGVVRALEDEGAGGRSQIEILRGSENDRAYYVVAAGGIAARAVASLQPARVAAPQPRTTER